MIHAVFKITHIRSDKIVRVAYFSDRMKIQTVRTFTTTIMLEYPQQSNVKMDCNMHV